MAHTLGARLRERREQRGIDLAAIAEQTKIKASLLQGLERDDVSQWPSGIYRRAYLRSYAQAIGLDPDPILREFVTVHPDPDEAAAAAADAAAAQNRTAAVAPPRRRGFMESALESFTRLRAGSTPADPVPSLGSDEIPQRARTPEPSPEPSAVPHAQPAIDEEEDLLALARLTTEFAKVDSAQDVQRLLQDAGRILGARGLIVWLWDATAEGLRPVLVHGYSPKVRAQLPTVKRDEENPTAAAFRLVQPRMVDATERDGGAVAIPLVGRSGCEGVLAIELRRGRARTAFVEAAATILGALIAQLVGRPRPAPARPEAAPAPPKAQPVTNYLPGGSLAHARS